MSKWRIQPDGISWQWLQRRKKDTGVKKENKRCAVSTWNRDTIGGSYFVLFFFSLNKSHCADFSTIVQRSKWTSTFFWLYMCTITVTLRVSYKTTIPFKNQLSLTPSLSFQSKEQQNCLKKFRFLLLLWLDELDVPLLPPSVVFRWSNKLRLKKHLQSWVIKMSGWAQSSPRQLLLDEPRSLLTSLCRCLWRRASLLDDQTHGRARRSLSFCSG